jgi:Flp pilus assembly protein TadD
MQRQFDSAQQLLEQEIKLSSSPADLRSLLASVDLAAGRSEKAVAGLQLALSEKPDVPDYHLQLALAHKQRKDLDQAASVLDAAVQKFPKDDRVLWESVAITEQRGDRQKALERYRMLQQLTPENANVLNNIAFSLAELGRDLDEALSLAERAVRQDPQSPGFADTLAWVQFKRGNTDAALRTFQNLVQRFPDDAGYQEHLKAAQAAQKR